MRERDYEYCQKQWILLAIMMDKTPTIGPDNTLRLEEIIFSDDFATLDIPGRFFSLAKAYLNACSLIFSSLHGERIKPTYSNALVGAFLLEQAIELLLKGALLKKHKRPKMNHELDKLMKEYNDTFPEDAFRFSADIQGVVNPARGTKHFQTNRYPIDKNGSIFSTDFYFTLERWGKQLELYRCDFDRIINAVDNSSSG